MMIIAMHHSLWHHLPYPVLKVTCLCDEFSSTSCCLSRFTIMIFKHQTLSWQTKYFLFRLPNFRHNMLITNIPNRRQPQHLAVYCYLAILYIKILYSFWLLWFCTLEHQLNSSSSFIYSEVTLCWMEMKFSFQKKLVLFSKLINI